MLTKEYLETSPWKPDLFKGKVAFVTGGAGTICRVQTEALVLLGADACILGRRKDHTEKVAKEIQALRPGSKVIGLGEIDVRSFESLQTAARTVYDRLGSIDFVIAGAAGNFLADIDGLSSRAFKSVIDIDLLGSFNTAKALFPYLVKSKGRLLFVSATLHRIGMPLQTHSSAAKAGVDSLATTLALQMGPSGITVNAIAPGPIEGTEGLDRLLVDDLRQRTIELSAAQRLGTSRDVADATVFLFTPAASYITGEVITVDGGSVALAHQAPLVLSRDFYPGNFIDMGKRAVAQTKL